jgi:transposase
MAGRYAGIDWASERHEVLVGDQAGAELLSATYAHDERGVSALCRMLVRMGVVLVAIERPDGVLVERLLDAGLRVLALHPNKVAAARDRFRVSGGKSDRFDAFVLCELARTDHHRFRVLEPDSDQTKAIRALTRAREDLVATRTGIVNQLRAELERFWPGPLALFSHMDAEILLAFLARYPSPTDARGLGVARMRAFLEREHYSGGQRPTALMAKLRSAPRGRIGELELSARRHLVLGFVAMIRTLNAQIKQLEGEIRTRVRAHPDGPIFLSLFKSPSSVITAAELLAEIGDCATQTGTRSPPTPARPQSPSSPANGERPGSAARATNASASRSAAWRTAAATGTPGPKTSTPRPANADTTTLARFAPSDAPGAESSGSAGATTPHTTPHATARCSATSPSPSPHRRALCPT